MNKYIIRATLAALGVICMTAALTAGYSDCTLSDRLFALVYMIALACSITEFIICLICYHHILWTNQDQPKQESQDGTK